MLQQIANFVSDVSGQQNLNNLSITENMLDPVLTPDFKSSFFKVFQKWCPKNKDAMNFSTFCSMLSQHMKIMKLEDQLETDWKRLSGQKSNVRVEDIANFFECSLLQAQEMIWEADYENEGVLSLYDLLDTLTTVFDATATKDSI